RGQPAMAQAEKDLYAAQKANSLANLYKDPNNLSPQQVQLLASEIGKIAQGGVTSQHELEAITPHTLNSQLAGITQKFTNQPSPANAAAFVKQYQDYANQLAKDAQKQIQDKYGRVIESKKGKLSDEDYQTLQNQYINRFKSDDIPDKTPPAPIHPVGSVITTKSGKSYKVVDDQGNLEEVKP
ncbi:hypothetical protein ACSFB2_12705, partial [Glaesserella parasuis]|uniref:hypothetical protein n=1 Tax=Glaesserella parasuis TaxID=738 RepID=UPI003F32E9F3